MLYAFYKEYVSAKESLKKIRCTSLCTIIIPKTLVNNPSDDVSNEYKDTTAKQKCLDSGGD